MQPTQKQANHIGRLDELIAMQLDALRSAKANESLARNASDPETRQNCLRWARKHRERAEHLKSLIRP